MAIIQEQFFKELQDTEIFFSYHKPDPANAKNFGVVICPAIFEEKQDGHRVLVNFGNLLAERGIHVLRFDFRGQGESFGTLHEFHPSVLTEDVKFAYQYLKELTNVEKIGMMGWRYGCNLMATAAKDLETEFLIGWSPIIDGPNYVKTILWTNLTNQMMVHRKIIEDRKVLMKKLEDGIPVDVDGYKLTLDWHKYISEDNLAESLNAVNSKGLFLDVCANPDQVSSVWNRFVDGVDNSTEKWRLKRVQGDTFWRLIQLYAVRPKNVFDETLSYLDEYFGS